MTRVTERFLCARAYPLHMRAIRNPRRMWWHRYAVLEHDFIASTYTVLSWHISRRAAWSAMSAIYTHFYATGNTAMVANNEWIARPAGQSARLVKRYPKTTRQPGVGVDYAAAAARG